MIERIRLKPKPKKPEKRGVTILDAVKDPHLFAEAFRDQKSWNAWRSLLAALFGLPMSDEQLNIFQECTGRQTPSSDGYKDAYLVCGRRGGKSFTLSLIACYLACFRDWKPYLQRGERATIMVIATDRRQARVIMRFITGLLNSSPLLKAMIEHQTREAISLDNSVQIEIHTSSFKSTRGYAIVAALLDELAFWPTSDESAEPDREVVAALRPGMSMIPDAMLLCASSAAFSGTHTRKPLKKIVRHWSGKLLLDE